MMDLILWRHAEAHEGQEGEDDLLRRLTPRGEKQAARMAAWNGAVGAARRLADELAQWLERPDMGHQPFPTLSHADGHLSPAG